MPNPEKYSIRYLSHGEVTIYAQREGETFHCGLGPAVESKLLYVDQLELEKKWEKSTELEPLVIWDVGLGAAANATAVLSSWRESSEGHLHLISFDQTLEPLQCALDEHKRNSDHFLYLKDWQCEQLMQNKLVKLGDTTKSLTWELRMGDFVRTLSEAAQQKFALPKPQAVLYDSYSPARNYDMWTLSHWKNLRTLCSDANTTIVSYSRATGVRVTMMLAGFFIGRGFATGEKEETTLASTRLESLREPFDHKFLERVKKSDRSQPFTFEEYRGEAISPEWLEKLSAHPQFR
jgi:tRNA U34 5-methylaminomethyl-2-thiouridine-forming methyltransferase MnmC